MQERIKELELRYKYFLLKKYLKYLLLVILISVIAFCFFVLMQKYNVGGKIKCNHRKIK